MINSKSTKKAMLCCMVSMLVCFAMLVGSTFAWFSDSVTSTNNKIVAGNLNIEVTHTNSEIANQSIDDKDATLFPVTLWEPGVVSYETFTIQNAGNLAFDYVFKLAVTNYSSIQVTTPEGEVVEKSLKDVIQLGVIEGSVVEGTTREQLVEAVKAVPTEVEDGSVAKNFGNFGDFGFEGSMEKGATEKTFTIVAYWEPTEFDNDFNGKEGQFYIDMIVNVIAKQRAYERDSFGDNYDEKSEYPVATSEQLLDALREAKSGDKIVLSDGNYYMPKNTTMTVPAGVTITGGSNAILNINNGALNNPDDVNEITSGILLDNDDVTISGVTVNGISNKNATSNSSYYEYNAMIRITGNNVILDNVTVTAKLLDSAVVIASTASAENKITIKNCNLSARWKAVHIVDGTKGTVNIEGSNLTGTYPINVNTNSVLQLVVKKSTLKGFTSYGQSVSKAVFEECKFEKDGSNKYLVAYADTDFINCDFGDGFLAQTKNNYSKTMTFTNCNKAGTKITAENVKQLFHAANDSDSIDAAKGWTVIVDGTTIEPNN